MKAPNREQELRKIWDEFPPTSLEIIDGDMKFPNDDLRRIYLLDVLIPKLNKVETQGEWGFLIKAERNPPYVPADIIVWKDDLTHFDVLTDSGITWGPDGPIQSNWEFGAVEPEDGDEEPPTTPPTPPEPEDPKTVIDLFAKLNVIEQKCNDIMDKLEHYDREFKAIQPQLQALLEQLGRVGGLDLGGIIGGIFGRKK